MCFSRKLRDGPRMAGPLAGESCTVRNNYLDVPLEVLVKGWDQWVITPRNIPFIGR